MQWKDVEKEVVVKLGEVLALMKFFGFADTEWHVSSAISSLILEVEQKELEAAVESQEVKEEE